MEREVFPHLQVMTFMPTLYSFTRRTISLIINHVLIVKANSSVISSGQLIVVDLIIRYGCLAISCLAIS